jgi:hypothetical protein
LLRDNLGLDVLEGGWRRGGGGAFRRVTESSSFSCQSSSKFLPAAVAPTHFYSCQTSSSFRRLTGFPFLSEADRRSLFFAAVRLLFPQLSGCPFLSRMATSSSFPRLSGLPYFSGFLTLVICHFLSATSRIILPFHSCQLLLLKMAHFFSAAARLTSF